MIEFLCDSSSLLLTKVYKLVWRKNLDSHAQLGRKVNLISCNEAYRLTRDSNLKEGFIVRTRLGVRDGEEFLRLEKQFDNIIFMI